MEKDKATETNAQKIATEENKVVVTPSAEDDLEARNKALEIEKAKILEERDNYKFAYLKDKAKKGENPEDEEEDDKTRRMIREELANSRLADIARDQDAIITKALRENKELKLANMNKGGTTSSVGTHSESQQVKDTVITPEQMSAFRAQGRSDKWIESYKKNLIKHGR